MLTGRNIRADKAKKMGLVHQLVDTLGNSVIFSFIFLYLPVIFYDMIVRSIIFSYEEFEMLSRSWTEESRGENY